MLKILRATPRLGVLVLMVGILYLAQGAARAQSPRNALLPDAPAAQEGSSQSGSATAHQSGSATLSGTIVATNGDLIEGARVMLRDSSGAETRTARSGSGGEFVLSGVAPGSYTLSVTASGMSSYSSPEIALAAGDVHIVPQIVLAFNAGETSITVTAGKEELAEEQVQIAVKQRVFGVLPNFYSAYDWNAPPMQAKQKFKLSLRAAFDPTAFLIIAGIAGAQQYQNVFPAFGGGLEGYGKRYGATFANHVSDQIFARAVYPSIFRQDPRYFYKGAGSFNSRALYAISASVIARGDDGRWKPNYSSVLGKMTSGALSNLYYPASERGAGLVFFNAFIEIGGDAAENLIREFILKGITSHVSRTANGQP